MTLEQRLPAGRTLYFDWNATTPPHPEVLRAMQAAWADAWGNPASIHAVGQTARAVIEDAREGVAALASVDPRDVVFTSGATEANNLALRGAPALVTSRLEHPSVIKFAERLEAEGRPVRWLPVGERGTVAPADVAAALEGLTGGFTVALQAANHETGALQPVREVAGIVSAMGGRLHVDAAQAAGKVPPELWQSGDTVSLAAHKMRGPKGIGALVLRSPGKPTPVLLGGAQERGLRPGTLDPGLAAGFGAAARMASESGPARYAPVATLRDRLECALEGVALVNAASSPRLPHVSNVSFVGYPGPELVAALDLAGLAASSGSACSAGTSDPSPVLTAMVGLARARSAVRFSLGDVTQAGDVDLAISLIDQVLRAMPRRR